MKIEEVTGERRQKLFEKCRYFSWFPMAATTAMVKMVIVVLSCTMVSGEEQVSVWVTIIIVSVQKLTLSLG